MAVTAVSFLVPLIFWSSFVQPAVLPRWIFLSVALPLILLSIERAPRSKAFWVGGLWLAWAALSLAWATSLPDGLLRLWQFILAGAAFVIGTGLSEKQINRCLVAFALGMCINAVIAMGQFIGVGDFWFHATPIAGLQVNGNYLAEAALMAGVAAFCLRKWWLLPLLLIALFLPQSRGAVAALLMVSVVWLWPRVRWASVGLFTASAVVAVAYVLSLGVDHPSLADRTALFANAFAGITLFGHGIGSFWSTFPLYYDALVATSPHVYGFEVTPRTAHNDLLTVSFETGIIGLGLMIAFLVMMLRKRDDVCWYVVISFLALGAFNFPAYIPTTVFLAALCAGFLCRTGPDVRVCRYTRGLTIQ